MVTSRLGLQVDSLPQVGRKLRRPSHNFNIRFQPWQIQPFMLAPVLAGDTMKNLLMQSRTVTDPLKSTAMGWWLESFFFYVKLRDITPYKANLEQMLIANTAHGIPAGDASADTGYHGTAAGIPFGKLCLNEVVEHYFRSDEERRALVTPMSYGMPQAKVNISDYLESMKIGIDAPENVPGSERLPDEFYPDLPPHLSSFSDAYTQWQQLQNERLSPPTFEDYLKTFGVSVPKAERVTENKPELLRYVRDWKMPSVTVNAVDGKPSGAVVWDTAERADKDRFFAEPGFIFGCTVARPKVLRTRIKGLLANHLDNAYAWLPALLSADPYTSLRKFAQNGAGPIPDLTEDYWVDLADLFLNGEQFTNFDPQTITDAMQPANRVTLPAQQDVATFEFGDSADADSLPQARLNKDYPTDADTTALFADLAVFGNSSKHYLRADGRVDIAILSRVTDSTT
jgi:hypothetical protein